MAVKDNDQPSTHVRIVSRNDPTYMYLKLKLSFHGVKTKMPNKVELKTLFVRGLSELHGEASAAIKVDILKFHEKSGEILVRVNGVAAVKFWSAMTLLSDYNGTKCMFTVSHVPYEILNKKFRIAQKNIDREISHVQNASSELEKCLQGGEAGAREVSRVLDGVVEKLTLLKRKAEESISDETEAAKSCKRRVDHLKDFENLSLTAQSHWKKQRLNRMMVDYFLRSGYYDSALDLASHSGIEELTNIELFMVSREVEESLLGHETTKCLSWCHDNKGKLRKLKSSLEFNLRQQEFVELIRENRRLEAVKHARKFFTQLDDHQLPDVQRVMGLLAFPADTKISPYKELFDPVRWMLLVEQFRSENFKIHQLGPYSMFGVCLQAGLSALKTPHCYKESLLNIRNSDCPVCSPQLHELARNLPHSHCAQSRLICAIDGCALDENNPPLMLPNGHVYGSEALANMAAMNDGKITCPRTQDVFTYDETEKVFVM